MYRASGISLDVNHDVSLEIGLDRGSIQSAPSIGPAIIPSSQTPCANDSGPTLVHDNHQDSAATKKRFIEQLYQDCYYSLRRRLISLVRDEELAHDLAQDAFIKVGAIDNPSQLQHPKAYLFKTALNLVRDHAKAQKVRNHYKQDLLNNEDYGVDSLSPEEMLLGQERIAGLQKAIDSLPYKCRQIFLLHRQHNYSHKQIAAIIGISKYTVERHVIRAMSRYKTAQEQATLN